MLRVPFDQFIKSILCEALTPAGTVRHQFEVIAEAQAVDTRFDPDPARLHELDALGRPGDMPRVPSAIRKQLTVDHVESSRARRKKQPTPPFPHLWILSAGRPDGVLDGHDFTRSPSFPAGFFQRSRADAVGLVVLRELPRTRDTLLLRLMAAGAVLEDALHELDRLPEDTREREVTITSLVAFRKKISHDPTDEERAFLMSTEPLYDEWKKQVKAEGRNEGRSEGRNEGREEGRREVLLDLLATRFGELPETAVARVKAADAAQLGRWVKRVLTATTLADVLREP